MSPIAGPFTSPSADDVGSAQRKLGRLPTVGQTKRLPPAPVVGSNALIGGGEQDVSFELAGPEPIERAPRRGLVGKLGPLVVGSAKEKHSLLGIRQAQARGKTLGVLLDEHGERREPERGVRREPERLLGGDQPGEAHQPRHAAEQSGEQAVVEQRLHSPHRRRRDENAPELPRHPLSRQLVETCL